jgi:cell division protein FtsI/penicillin-binding protein 2
MLSHVLGFLGKNNKGDQVAYYGLEQYYDGYLSGRDGLLVQEKDASGKPILFGGVASYDGIDGSDLSLTIDRKKQFILEKHLKESFERHNPKSAVGIILEPQTGKVLAMAKYPSFVPSDYREIEDQVTIRNDAIGGVYEPGSILKALTMSVAIDLGKVKPEDTYNDTGPKIFSDYTVDNWDGKHHGVIDMTRILQLSNNLGIAWVGKQAGDAQLIEYFKQYGMNKFTGIDLGGEEKGLMNDNLPLRDIELANLSFGQGISVTPIQMAMAFTAIANNGTMMKPYIVSKIKSSDKEQIINPQPIAKPISAQTASIMVDMLTQTVSGGEAKFFVSKKYMIAGKTGTAQVPVKGGYSPDRTNATFVGFLPKYKNFVMLIKLEEPTSPSGYAAETAVPTWMAIADELAGLDGLLPDRQ